MMKQIMQMDITWLKIPTGRRQTRSAIYNGGQGVELGSTEKQLQLSGQLELLSDLRYSQSLLQSTK